MITLNKEKFISLVKEVARLEEEVAFQKKVIAHCVHLIPLIDTEFIKIFNKFESVNKQIVEYGQSCNQPCLRETFSYDGYSYGFKSLLVNWSGSNSRPFLTIFDSYQQDNFTRALYGFNCLIQYIEFTRPPYGGIVLKNKREWHKDMYHRWLIETSDTLSSYECLQKIVGCRLPLDVENRILCYAGVTGGQMFGSGKNGLQQLYLKDKKIKEAQTMVYGY